MVIMPPLRGSQAGVIKVVISVASTAAHSAVTIAEGRLNCHPVIPVPCPMLHKETQERGQRLDRGGKGDGGPLVMHGEGDRVTNEYF